MLATALVQFLVENLQQSIEMPLDLGQFRPLDDAAHEPLEHGVEQAARVEGVEPAVRVVVKRLGGLDAEAISKKEPPRTASKHLEAVRRGRSPMIRPRIEQPPRSRHKAVVRRELSR